MDKENVGHPKTWHQDTKSDVQARVCHTPSEYIQTQYPYKLASRQLLPGIVRLTQSTIQSYQFMEEKVISDGKSVA